MRRLVITCVSLMLFVPWPALSQQNGLKLAPPAEKAQPPSLTATPEELERRGDELRADKAFLDSIDYYRAALGKTKTAALYNKLGIAELQMDRLGDARKDFGRAIKMDKTYAEAFNNLGVAYYKGRKYDRAIREYTKAIALQDSASFHSNLGSAYFSKKRYELAALEYNRAIQLDPDIFERMSGAGIAAHLQSPEDHARFSFVLAKMYARLGNFDRSLKYLQRALEDGYKVNEEVYKDKEFAKLREDPRFAELMSKKMVSIPQ